MAGFRATATRSRLPGPGGRFGAASGVDGFHSSGANRILLGAGPMGAGGSDQNGGRMGGGSSLLGGGGGGFFLASGSGRMNRGGSSAFATKGGIMGDRPMAQPWAVNPGGGNSAAVNSLLGGSRGGGGSLLAPLLSSSPTTPTPLLGAGVRVGGIRPWNNNNNDAAVGVDRTGDIFGGGGGLGGTVSGGGSFPPRNSRMDNGRQFGDAAAPAPLLGQGGRPSAADGLFSHGADGRLGSGAGGGGGVSVWGDRLRSVVEERSSTLGGSFGAGGGGGDGGGNAARRAAGFTDRESLLSSMLTLQQQQYRRQQQQVPKAWMDLPGAINTGTGQQLMGNGLHASGLLRGETGSLAGGSLAGAGPPKPKPLMGEDWMSMHRGGGEQQQQQNESSSKFWSNSNNNVSASGFTSGAGGLVANSGGQRLGWMGDRGGPGDTAAAAADSSLTSNASVGMGTTTGDVGGNRMAANNTHHDADAGTATTNLCGDAVSALMSLGFGGSGVGSDGHLGGGGCGDKNAQMSYSPHGHDTPLRAGDVGGDRRVAQQNITYSAATTDANTPNMGEDEDPEEPTASEREFMKLLRKAKVSAAAVEKLRLENLLDPDVVASLDPTELGALEVSIGDKKRIQMVAQAIKQSASG